jgi:hypothetical protein
MNPPCNRCRGRDLPSIAALSLALLAAHCGYGQGGVPPASSRRLGAGPFATLILSSAFLIDGTESRIAEPVDIFVSGNRITKIVPSTAAADRPPEAVTLDLRGKYVLPGFIDTHAHVGLANAPVDYICLLLLAHGITSVREVSPGQLLQQMQELKQESQRNARPSPRLFLYPSTHVSDASDLLDKGVDGLKTYAMEPRDELHTLFALAHARGVRVAIHDAGSIDALELTSLGLTSLEHFFGLPESIGGFRPLYPKDFERGGRRIDGFRRYGGLWQQATASANPGEAYVIQALVGHGVTLVPTFSVYEALRNVVAARNTAWSHTYIHPSLRRFFDSGRDGDFSFWAEWTTNDEAEWTESFRLWEAFVLRYLESGGQVAVGADSGFMYDVWGFGYVREMELLREAGLSALQVIHAATATGAKLLGMGEELGTVEPGKLADMVVCNEDPLLDFSVLYATGQRCETSQSPTKSCAIELVIKDGIIYDGAWLREEVRRIVATAE